MKYIFPRSRRFSCIFLVIFLVFLSIFPLAPPVQAAPDVIISISDATVTSGDTTVVTVKAQGVLDPGLSGYRFKINYNNDAVELVGLSGTPDFPAPINVFTAPQPNPSKVPGEIWVVAAQFDGYGTSGDIDLFNLTFKALSSTAQVVPIELTVDDEGFSDADLHDIPYIISNGSITIESIPAPTLTASPAVLTESAANDGSLSPGEITLTLANGTFATEIGIPDLSITGLPPGMDYLVTRTSGTTLKVTLTGKATSHTNTDDATLTLTLNKAKVIGANEDISGTVSLDFMSNNDATLSNITLSTGELTPAFDQNITTYNVTLPVGSEVPIVNGILPNTGAKITSITQASNLNGTESERTASILVTAEDGISTKIYTVIFSLMQSSNPLIQSVVPSPASQITGRNTSVSVSVNTVGISDGTAITVELVGSDGISLSPVVSSSSIVQNDAATLILNVPTSVAPGSYRLKVVSSGITDDSTGYIVLPMYGDVNNTGDVNITDALQVLKAITNPSLFNNSQRIAADVNGDSSVNITDALLILKHITNPIPFPIENK